MIRKSLVLLTAIISCYAHIAAQGNENTTLIDNYLEKKVKDGFTGGLLIIKDGRPLLMKGYGFANREKQIQFTEKTLACMGSITKAYTATAILKLYEQGKLKLSDPLSNFFPNVPNDKAGITIHQLLTHSSGFREFLENDGGDYEVLPKEDFLKRAFAQPLAFVPGSKSVYTNVGMSVAAAIVEKVSGIGYATFLQQQLFIPAGTKHIGYQYPVTNEDAIAIGYDKGQYWGTLQQRFQKNGGGPYWNLLGNGGLYISLEDMYTWVMAIEKNKVLKSETKDLMFTPQIVEDGTNGSSSFGYGCNISKSRRGTKLIDNGGSNGIYHARLVRLPEEGVMMYMVSTDNTLNTNQLLPNVTQLYFTGTIETDFTQQQQRFETEAAKTIYTIIIEKGADNFLANYAVELQKKGLTLDDDMILLNVGNVLTEEKKLEEAMALYKVYTTAFPNIVFAWNELGFLYKMKGDKPNARKCFEKALVIRPSNARAKKALEEL
ncbi:MAG: serine hydrolase [Chitinophagaceae bacterium]